jgi:hypothetical protein
MIDRLLKGLLKLRRETADGRRQTANVKRKT